MYGKSTKMYLTKESILEKRHLQLELKKIRRPGEIWALDNPRGAKRLPSGLVERESDLYLEDCGVPLLRSIILKAPSMPLTPGVEALGVVIVVIPRLIHRQVGYVVAYGKALIGSFAEELQKGCMFLLCPNSLLVSLFGDIEVHEVSIVEPEALSILKASLTSTSVLTEVVQELSEKPKEISATLRTDYESWSQRIRLYCRGKENGLLILQSIDQGPFELGTTRNTLGTTPEGGVLLGPERPRTYEDLSDTEKKRYNADVRATNIVLQGLPKDIYKSQSQN
ncbi:hypothetical protein Tco_0842650 [Tanacetum coccineum]|uniref:Uncharacterized protein n=1 Tax=Tanacetum coccineum TaxID=301880 RepID=A0ABQ5B354_9ASTR